VGQFTAQPPDGAAQRIELLDDHALVALVRSGDERGLGELYRRHAPTALRVARSLMRAGHEADDVVADVFGGIWQAIRSGKGPTSRFEAYLVAAIRNRARSLPSQAIGQPIDDHIAALATMDTEPETGNNVARQAFTRLPTREQQMLWLTAVEGSTVAEAATALSLTRRAATTLKYRAKRAFAGAYLAEYGTAESVENVCRELCPKLARCVRETCPPTAKRAVEVHISACPACRLLVRELTDVNATLRTVGPAAALAVGARGLSGGRSSIGAPLVPGDAPGGPARIHTGADSGARDRRDSSVRAATDHDNSGPTDHPICASCARRDRDGVRHERFGRRAPAG